MDKITIKNLSTGIVLLYVENRNQRYRMNPNSTIMIEQDVYDEMLNDAGICDLFERGAIGIMKDGKANRPEESSYVTVASTAHIDHETELMSAMEVKTMLTTGSVADLLAALKVATPTTKESIVELAIQNNITDAGRVTLINKYCGVNVLDAIAARSQI